MLWVQLSWGLLTSQAHRRAAQPLVLHSEQQLQHPARGTQPAAPQGFPLP